MRPNQNGLECWMKEFRNFISSTFQRYKNFCSLYKMILILYKYDKLTYSYRKWLTVLYSSVTVQHMLPADRNMSGILSNYELCWGLLFIIS